MPLEEQKFSDPRPLLSILFPQGFKKSKRFGHWTSGNGGKKLLNGGTNEKKIAAANLDHISKNDKSLYLVKFDFFILLQAYFNDLVVNTFRYLL